MITTNFCKIAYLPDTAKTSDSFQKETNLESKVITEYLELEDKTEILPQQHTFLFMKDHEPNFRNHPKCRLINPAKSNLGKVIRQLLDNINSAERKSAKFQQWLIHRL